MTVDGRDYVNVEIKSVDDKGKPQIITRVARTNIFQPCEKEQPWKVKIKTWLMNLIDNTLSSRMRFNRIHKILKIWFIHPGLKIAERIVGKFLIRTDKHIVPEWYNNHIRIFKHSYEQGMKHAWINMVYQQLKHKTSYKNVSALELYGMLKTKRSHTSRMLMCDLFVNIMLEDTFDRESVNGFMLTCTHEMMQLYGINPVEAAKVPLPEQFPAYKSITQHDKDYFIKYIAASVWQPTMYVKEAQKDEKINETNNPGPKPGRKRQKDKKRNKQQKDEKDENNST